ncbi:MAG: HypC/HybG/HupF family hydrogenase formation chaperone [Proteobacteria bacterium]|nr:HypC/HybG/HupF family hydrogenase formation chaperone [Pseudomonadota bacterium]
MPSRVLAIDGLTATVEAEGEQRNVSLMLLDDEVALGDYLLIQAGGFAFERVDAQRAEESLSLMREIAARGEADIRAW